MSAAPASAKPAETTTTTKRKKEQTPVPFDEKKLKLVPDSQKSGKGTIDEDNRKGGKGKTPSLLYSLRESRRADTENNDHLDMRAHAVKALGEGADKSELEKSLQPGEWATRAHWTLMRKVLHIGFNVYELDGLELIFKFADPSDEPHENHLMVNLLFDGCHYDLIIFGELSDVNLQGFVFFYFIVNLKALFFSLTESQRASIVRGFTDEGKVFNIVGYAECPKFSRLVHFLGLPPTETVSFVPSLLFHGWVTCRHRPSSQLLQQRTRYLK